MKQFGEENYKNVAYFNFENEPSLHGLFEGNLSPQRIISQLSIQGNTEILPNDTLLIFDEIQECPRALTSLKYFEEEAPEYHVICAGSLLGLHLNSSKRKYDQLSTSFPVGKVQFLDLHPMDFEEFLLASGDGRIHEFLRTMDVHEQVPENLVPLLKDRLNEFQIVGGMPNAVSDWVDNHSLPRVSKIHSDILSTYRNDLSKHPVDSKGTLYSVWDSIPMQLMKDNTRFIFGQSVKGARSADLESSVQWLKNAGLVQKVIMIERPAIPLPMYAKSFYKLYMSDVGLFSSRSGVPPSFINSSPEDYKEFKGAMAESLVLQELNTHVGGEHFYWRSGAEAEVDFVVPLFYEPIPIEVKSGPARSSKSLRVYRERYGPRVAVKASMDPESSIERVTHIPLYMTWRIKDYAYAALESTGWTDPEEDFAARHRSNRVARLHTDRSRIRGDRWI